MSLAFFTQFIFLVNSIILHVFNLEVRSGIRNSDLNLVSLDSDLNPIIERTGYNKSGWNEGNRIY